MSKEVTKIIDTLCKKLGVAAHYLIPELAKKEIAQDVVGIALCVIALAAVALFVRWAVKKNTDEDGDMNGENIFCVCAFPVIIGVIAFIILSAITVNLAGWIASPTAMAIEKITEMIK